MIKHLRSKQPDYFDEKVKIPGKEHLAKNPNSRRLPNFWQHCQNDLAIAFKHLCAYTAMRTQNGTVDHYLSKKKFPEHAYDWDNYRYADSNMNSRKRTRDRDILDPFEIKDGWFEIHLPSLQLLPTSKIPRKYRERAVLTIKQLRLQDDEHIVENRQEWLKMYTDGELTLKGLRRVAPLVARAVERKKKASSTKKNKSGRKNAQSR